MTRVIFKRLAFIALTAATLIAGLPYPASKVLAREVKGPAVRPADTAPLGARQRIAFEYEDRLSQILGSRVRLTSFRIYKEQNGSETSCTVGNVQGRRFRLVSDDSGTSEVTSEKEWIAVGCTRPDYQLLR